MVVSVGIDVSKDKHDCFIVNSESEILADVFMPFTMRPSMFANGIQLFPITSLRNEQRANTTTSLFLTLPRS